MPTSYGSYKMLRQTSLTLHFICDNCPSVWDMRLPLPAPPQTPAPPILTHRATPRRSRNCLIAVFTWHQSQRGTKVGVEQGGTAVKCGTRTDIHWLGDIQVSPILQSAVLTQPSAPIQIYLQSWEAANITHFTRLFIRSDVFAFIRAISPIIVPRWFS